MRGANTILLSILSPPYILNILHVCTHVTTMNFKLGVRVHTSCYHRTRALNTLCHPRRTFILEYIKVACYTLFPCSISPNSLSHCVERGLGEVNICDNREMHPEVFYICSRLFVSLPAQRLNINI